jgi:hypothetical protein
MKDGDKWTLYEKDGGETTFRVRVIDAPQPRYNENGIRIRRCRSCFMRTCRSNPRRPLWRGEEERLAMIEAGDLEENTYWCEGLKPRPAVVERWRENTDWDDPESVERFHERVNGRSVEAHEHTKTERTQQYEDKQAAEWAEQKRRWAELDGEEE